MQTTQKPSQVLFDKWDALSNKDKTALSVLVIFLLVFGGGYGGLKMHKAAKQQQDAYHSTINDYFWLRGQAANIDPSQTTDDIVAIDQKITQILSQSGVKDQQVLRVGDNAQISFLPPNPAVASNILNAIANNGYYIKNLTMQQNPQNKALKVQATIAPSS